MSYDVPGGGKKGSNFVDKSDWVAPFNGRMLMASSHQHGGAQVPDAPEPHLQAPAVQGARLPRAREPRLQHDPPDPARAGPDRQRRVRQLPGHPDREGRGAAPHGGARQPQPARGLDGLLGHLVREGRLGEEVRQAAQGHRRDQQAEALRPHARTTTSWCRSWRSRRARSARSTAARSRSATTSSGPAGSPRRSASRSRGGSAGTKPHSVTVANGPRGFSSVYWGTQRGTLHRHAEGQGHLQARLPGAPDDDGGDAGR